MQFTSDDTFNAAAERIIERNKSSVQTASALNPELIAKLQTKIRDSRLLTESALKVTKSYDIRANIRKAPRFFGKAAFAVLTGSIVTAAVFQGGEVEQFKALSELLNLTDLSVELGKSIANGDFKEYLNGLWDKVSNNSGGYLKYGAYQLALAKAKGAWDNITNDVLGAYASGVLKLEDQTVVQSASVIAAYDRLGVPLTIDGNTREIEQIQKEIEELVDRADYMSASELAHFMKATGVLDSEGYCMALNQAISKKVDDREMDQFSAVYSTRVAMRVGEHAEALVQMYDADASARQAAPNLNKFMDNIIFTQDEFNRVGSLLKKAGALDDGGMVKNKKAGNIAKELVTEHILASLETGNTKVISELKGAIGCMESVFEKSGIKDSNDLYRLMGGQTEGATLKQKVIANRVYNSVNGTNIDAILATSREIKDSLEGLKSSQVSRPRNGLR
ncbi:hypothetical protein OTK49_21210 [Vibrio coralliirubri]|uniref:hypothetical protein n=1 Tax=Vibrio coralliirubri TaxID=1516159 RepID=UPI002284D854|nr:hypothetical protein [Vibrio coralliirubri]MCY9865040.1 hypothetical protein [Vibrio coralliirubri]